MSKPCAELHLATIDWQSITQYETVEAAIALDRRLRAIAKAVEYGWWEIGHIANVFQEQALWKVLSDPVHDEPYRTYTGWLESAAPGGMSRRTCNYNKRLVTVLAGIPVEDLRQIRQSNAFILADGIKSERVRLNPEVIEAAKKLGQDEFVEKIQHDFPEQALERRCRLVFHLEKSAEAVVLAVLDRVGALLNIPDRDGQLEALCVDWKTEHWEEELHAVSEAEGNQAEE